MALLTFTFTTVDIVEKFKFGKAREFPRTPLENPNAARLIWCAPNQPER